VGTTVGAEMNWSLMKPFPAFSPVWEALGVTAE
jgi:hypothetical protein